MGWSEWVPRDAPDGGIVGSPTTIARRPGATSVFARGADDALWQRSCIEGRWQDWVRHEGLVLGAAPTAGTMGPDHEHVFVRGADDHLHHTFWLADRGWSVWFDLGAPPVGFVGAPATISRNSQVANVYVRGGDDALWQLAWYDDQWHGWGRHDDTTLGSTPALGSMGPDHEHVFVRGPDGHLHHKFWLADKGWSVWFDLGAPDGGLVDAPATISRNSRCANVYARGTQDVLWAKSWWDDQWHDWVVQSNGIGDPPAAGAAGPDHEQLFARGTDGKVWHLWWTPQTPVVTVDALEVTQVIQDLGHTVPLVAGKATVVRAYLRCPAAPVEVQGQLGIAHGPDGPWQAVRSLDLVGLDPERGGADATALRSRRADCGASLNFALPAQFTTAGDLWLRLQSVVDAAGGMAVTLAPTDTIEVACVPAPPLRVRVVQVRYQQAGTTYAPTADDLRYAASWLRRAYPTSTVDLSTSSMDATATPPFEAPAVHAQLVALRAVDIGTGTDPRTHYYGMVSDGGFFMRGRASGVPGTPTLGVVAAGPAGTPAGQGWTWDNDVSYADWYTAHELAHTFGRPHAEFCGATGGAPYPYPNGLLSDVDEQFVGLDVGDPALGLPLRALPATTSHDVMTYCDNQWLSSFTYPAILERLRAEEVLGAAGSAGPAAPLDAPTAPATVHLVASVDLTRETGSIAAVLPAGHRPPPEPSADAETLTVRWLDPTDVVLGEHPVPLHRTACLDPGEDVTGIVDVHVPVVDGAATVELLRADRVLDRHPVGGEPTTAAVRDPGAPLRGPQAGQTPGAAEVDLRWDAAPATAGQRYMVQVSTDGGVAWRTVAVGLTEPTVTLPTETVGAETADVRVLSTTGTATTVGASRRVVLR